MKTVLGVLWTVLIYCSSVNAKADLHSSNPYSQDLPDCTQGHVELVKKTNKKAILCPMFRDEEGFLSEWIAYYQIHGFDHIILFDDESVDRSLDEVQPWIDSGYVTVRSNWTVESLKVHPAFLKSEFKKAMTVKALLERECKLQALEWGFDYFVSLDIDEYLVVRAPGVTAVDALDGWFTGTGRSVYCMHKLNFQSAPHVLEPVNLLTIEAYQTRMTQPSKMSYYTTVSPKCAYKLRGEDYRVNSTDFIVNCCFFHGCQKHDFRSDITVCGDNHKTEMWQLNGKGKPYYETIDINHYSRSMEKYVLKGRTWKTSGGEVMPGQTDASTVRSYDMPKFMARSVGGMTDRSILRYTCQAREQLKKMTGQAPYLRPGTGWYRNPEFGKEVTDPEKRGRYGRPSPPGFKFYDPNLYHYHGGDVMGENATLISPQGEKMPWSEWTNHTQNITDHESSGAEDHQTRSEASAGGHLRHRRGKVGHERRRSDQPRQANHVA